MFYINVQQTINWRWRRSRKIDDHYLYEVERTCNDCFFRLANICRPPFAESALADSAFTDRAEKKRNK